MMAIHVSKKLFPEEILMKDKIFGVLQRIGRSFMLPIAMVPPMWQDSWFSVDRIFSLPSWRMLLISPISMQMLHGIFQVNLYS